MAGSQRLLMRAASGLSSSYAATGDSIRARELFEDTSSQLLELGPQLTTVTFECGLAQLHLDLAVAAIRLGEPGRAASHLNEARASGWLDAHWLRTDSELQPLRTDPYFISWLDELDAAEPLNLALPLGFPLDLTLVA